jgi:hypothetical protein
MKKIITVAIMLLSSAVLATAQPRKCSIKKTTHFREKHTAAHKSTALRPYTYRYVSSESPAAPCNISQHNSIVVKECPDQLYTHNENVMYSRQRSFTGNYQSATKRESDVNLVPTNMVAPQHTVINNYKGAAPADGNYCIGCTSR